VAFDILVAPAGGIVNRIYYLFFPISASYGFLGKAPALISTGWLLKVGFDLIMKSADSALEYKLIRGLKIKNPISF